MIKSVHFLLTYSCNFACDHCFLYCGPDAQGTFTISQVRTVLEEMQKIPTRGSVMMEGGEPFLYYALMLEGLKAARAMGLKTGIVSNCYWATSVEDAQIWLRPLAELGISSLDLSDDLFHSEEGNGPGVLVGHDKETDSSFYFVANNS